MAKTYKSLRGERFPSAHILTNKDSPYDSEEDDDPVLLPHPPAKFLDEVCMLTLEMSTFEPPSPLVISRHC